MDTQKPSTTAAATASDRTTQDTQFASLMKDLEGELRDLQHMSYLATSVLDGLECKKGPSGDDMIRFLAGEQDAFYFAVYNVDNRLRSLVKAYDAAFEVYK